MPRPRIHALEDQVLTRLASNPAGLSAAEIRAALPVPVSQPTLSRRLMELRTQGKVVVEGRGPATRYRSASGHELPQLRSQHLHRAVARRLLQDPALIERAAERLAKLRQVNPAAARYHDRWEELLRGPRPRLLRMLTEDSEAAADLRQESPFSTLLTVDERQRVLAQLRV